MLGSNDMTLKGRRHAQLTLNKVLKSVKLYQNEFRNFSFLLSAEALA
jgi:hypothetical protein